MFFFNRQLVGFYRFREVRVASLSEAYISIVAISTPANFIVSVITGTFNASGNSRTPFIINCVGLVLNVILDPILIFVLGWGVEGAAIATVIAQVIVFLGMLWGITFYKGRPFARYSFGFKLDFAKIRQIFTWSTPVVVENIFYSGLAMITSRMEASFGASAIAASRVGSQIESLSWLIGGGFGSALISFIGQNYGASKRERIVRGVRISAILMAIWGAAVAVFLWTGGALVFSLFLPDPDMVKLGASYLFIFAFCQLPMNMESVASGAFKGQGKTVPPSVVSIVSNIIRPILAYGLSRTSLGLYGVWIGVSASACIRGIWMCVWYLIADRKQSAVT
jgi:putative MATE family efflux protein